MRRLFRVVTTHFALLRAVLLWRVGRWLNSPVFSTFCLCIYLFLPVSVTAWEIEGKFTNMPIVRYFAVICPQVFRYWKFLCSWMTELYNYRYDSLWTVHMRRAVLCHVMQQWDACDKIETKSWKIPRCDMTVPLRNYPATRWQHAQLAVILL
jgi:hypothetical protein